MLYEWVANGLRVVDRMVDRMGVWYSESLHSFGLDNPLGPPPHMRRGKGLNVS